jgi:uncharacterized membrane-anchored protein
VSGAEVVLLTLQTQYYVPGEAVIRRHVGIVRDLAIRPNQLRRIVETAKQNERVSIPFSTGAHSGMRKKGYRLHS